MINETKTPVFTATGADFEEVVIHASRERVVLVDFWAPWCGPCKALAPILEEVAQARPDRLKVVKVDVDEEQRLAQNHGVRALPTLILFHDGRPAEQLVGLQSAEAILTAVDALAES